MRTITRVECRFGNALWQRREKVSRQVEDIVPDERILDKEGVVRHGGDAVCMKPPFLER